MRFTVCVYSRRHYLTLLLACVQYVQLALVYWLYCLLDCASCITFLIDSTICYIICNVLLTGLYCLLLLVLCIIPKCTVYMWCMLGHTLLFEGARCTICMLGKYIGMHLCFDLVVHVIYMVWYTVCVVGIQLQCTPDIYAHAHVVL